MIFSLKKGNHHLDNISQIEIHNYETTTHN